MVKNPDTLSLGDRAIIKAESDGLQKAQRECNDCGIGRKIDVWIEKQKQKLASGPICGKPCPPEECVTVQGRSMHKKCYRASRISKHY
jgi:hypothetical protein